ncbi:MAG: hypothetical protein ACYSYV_11945 [Planctomycetota bacterium]|jgi:hypothetical protein
MNAKTNITSRPGIALLVVLFIVMTIAILSVGFLSRSDVELACGENMILRTQMDYLAESGLEHARGLILSPQDISPDIGRSSLEAELRLDPCIAYWAGANTTITQRITVNGDVYCGDSLSGNGYVGGDVFASSSITASNVTGQKNQAVIETPVDWPGLDVNDFSSSYYIDSTSYAVEVIDPNISDPLFGPSGANPAGIHYCSDPNAPATLNGNVTINGTLVVNGDLTIRGTDNVISAVKNFPALLVSGEVIVEDGGTLQVRGLAQIGQRIAVTAGAQNINIDGALFIANGGIEGSASSSISIDITVAPSIASIQTWPTQGTARRWSPVAGAFFRSIGK